MSVNVNRSVDDVFYRYKMPKLLAKVEGKGNGIKTVIANMTDVAKALNRPPSYPTKYFGCELGAQTQMDVKTERFIVNGEHDATKLQNLLDGFIKKFVLCPECDNPETILTVKRNQILQSCKACGNNGTIDPRHKLTTFIVKNPPDQEVAEVATTAAAPGKRGPGKAAVVKGKRNESAASPTSEEATGNGEDLSDENGAEKNGSGSDEVDEDKWDVNPDDHDARLQDLTGGIVGLTLNPDLDKSNEDRLDMFFNFIEKQKKLASLDAKAIVAEAERLDVKDKAVLLLCRALFNDGIVGQIKQHRVLLRRFTDDNKRAQRYLLGGLEQLFITFKDALLPKVSSILKNFYDEDILEEEVLLEWGNKSSKKHVSKEDNKDIRMRAQPFLKWLAEAEEESDENEEDDEVEIVYDEGKNKPIASKTQNGCKVGDDDLDIDDI